MDTLKKKKINQAMTTNVTVGKYSFELYRMGQLGLKDKDK